MKRLIPALIISLLPALAISKEKLPALPMFQKNSLQVSLLGGYANANMYGQDGVPSYTGMVYGGEMEYEFRIGEMSLAPFLGYHQIDLENSASNAVQSESIKGSKLLTGVRIGSQLIFAKAAAAMANYRDQASGTVNNTLDLKSTGFELGAGMSYPLSRAFSLRISLDYTYFKFDTTDSSINRRLDMATYTGALGLVYVVPSGK